MKNKYVDIYLKLEERLKKIIKSSLNKKDPTVLFSALNALCRLKYQYNQEYIDDDIEKYVLNIIQAFDIQNPISHKPDLETVIFYDSFGDDTRGLACIYLKALIQTGKRIIYISNYDARNKQPTIKKILSENNGIIEYVDRSKGYYRSFTRMLELFRKYNPAIAFEYNHPWDVEGIVLFSALSNCNRFKINLTDHAYWCGVNSFDYIIEFRDYGAYISNSYRKIEKNKILKLPFYPFIDKEVEFQGFPFEHENKKVIFSGGALYKTIDDSGLYYNIVRQMLKSDDDIVFLYAGMGDTSKLNEVMNEHPGRVFHIQERKDLYEILKHSYVYLSTYPMNGGLMTQYAAVAGCLPLTLRHNDDSYGVLINEETLKIIYDTDVQLLVDFKKLLNDEIYKKHKEEQLKYSVITEKNFNEELSKLLLTHSTMFSIVWRTFDTKEFLMDYLRRFGAVHLNSFVTIRNKALILYFPRHFLWKLKLYIEKKIKQTKR